MDLFNKVSVDPTLDTANLIDALVETDENRAENYDEENPPLYNPLEDTRPWYYATYNEVRGTDEIFTSTSGANGGRYVYDKYHDEY